MRATGRTFMVMLTFALAGCQASGRSDVGRNDNVALPEPEVSVEFEVQISAPQAGSARAQALDAMKRADGFTLYALAPFEPPPYPEDAPKYDSPDYPGFMNTYDALRRKAEVRFCKERDCLAKQALLGSVTVRDPKDFEAVRTALHDSLAQVPDFGTACAPIYRHAIGFRADRRHYQVLLCYECGKVGVMVDGEILEYADQTYGMGDEGALNAILSRAGIPLSE